MGRGPFRNVVAVPQVNPALLATLGLAGFAIRRTVATLVKVAVGVAQCYWLVWAEPAQADVLVRPCNAVKATVGHTVDSTARVAESAAQASVKAKDDAVRLGGRAYRWVEHYPDRQLILTGVGAGAKGYVQHTLGQAGEWRARTSAQLAAQSVSFKWIKHHPSGQQILISVGRGGRGFVANTLRSADDIRRAGPGILQAAKRHGPSVARVGARTVGLTAAETVGVPVVVLVAAAGAAGVTYCYLQ